jgi:TP901 family phage tail tape measure protein
LANRSITYAFRADISDFKAKIAAAGASVSDFSAKLQAEQEASVRSIGDQLDEVSSLGEKIGTTAGVGYGLAIAAAGNFEKALSSVQAATGESAANMTLLKEAALDAGQATVYSASEAAGAIEELAKAGISTEDVLDGGLAGALDLAAAGGLEVADAAEAAASAMTQFGLSGADVPHIADLLAAGAGKAQGSVEDMSMALNQSGLVAAQTGLSIEETTGALSAFASAGLTGSDAGTSFKTMLQALTPTSKEAAKLMDKLGITAYDSQGNFAGLTKFADSLRNGLADLTVEQQNAALKTIFGSDAVRAAAVIYQQGGKGIQEWIDKTNDAGYAAEQAAARTNNLAGDIEQLKGALETALIGTGEGQLGFLRSATQSATDFVNVFNALPNSVQNATGSLLGLVTVIGGALFFGPKIIAGIVATRAQLALLPIVATRARAALAGLVTTAPGLAKAALLVGGIGLAASGTTDKVGATNAVMGAMAGLMLGGLWGAAIGGGIGALLDFGSAATRARTSHESFTEALGSSDLKRIRDEIKATESDLDDLNDQMSISGTGDFLQDFIPGAMRGVKDIFADLPDAGDYELRISALQREERAAKAAAVADTEFGEALQDFPELAEESSESIVEMSKALEKSREAARGSATSFFNLGDSLDDSKKSLGEWLTELEQRAQALIDFQKNAERAADRGLREGLIAALEEAGEAGALRMAQLANGTDSEIERANRAWRKGQRAVNNYVDTIGGVPETVVTEIILDGVKDAKDTIRDLRRAIEGKPIRQTVVIDPVTGKKLPKGKQGTSTSLEDLLFGGSADGSTVPKGGNYRDQHPYLLAPGEEVVSDRFGQATDFRPELKDINAGLSRQQVASRMWARVDAAAASRPVGGLSSMTTATASSLSSADFDRLAQLVTQMRPLVGVQNVSPHDYNQFRREQDADARRGSIGGY